MTDEHKAILNSYSVPVSFKKSVEVCNFIRGKSTKEAKELLQAVMNKEIPVPYRRYYKEIPHRKGGYGTARWPVKTCKHILIMVKAIEANADDKGLNLSNLVITHISANKAGNIMHYGRQRSTRMKMSHFKLEVEEQPEKKKEEKKQKKGVKQ